MVKWSLCLSILIWGILMDANLLAENNIHIYTLNNGLEVVYQINRALPAVAIQIWVKAGSVHETNKQAGISHLIEHMLFKGTPTRGPGVIAKTIEGCGGSINAYTSFDYTVYHTVVPSREWQKGLEVLADAVRHSLFDGTELAREKKVVLEEIKRDMDSPMHILSDAIFSTAYKVYPYRRPIIGYKEVVEKLSRKDLLDYFKRWYQPQNMVLVAVGNFEEELFKEAVNRCFSEAVEQTSEALPIEEPIQNALRLKQIKKDVHETYLGLAFHIPGMGHDDAYAMDILSEILGAQESSRLNEALKLKEALVHSITSYAFTPKGPGLFIIQVTLDYQKIKEVLKEIFHQIDELKQKNVTSEELQRAKRSISADFIYDQEAVQGWARTLGYFQVIMGDARKKEEYLRHIQAVSPEDIRRVTQKYLSLEKLSLVLLMPEGANFVLKKSEIETLWPKYKQIKKIVLDNGLTLLLKENHRLPTFSVTAVFLGGLRAETKATSGISDFVARMFTRGTKRHSAIEIAEMIDNMAGHLEGFSGWNTFGVTGHFLSQFFEEALSLTSEVIKEPSFPEEELEKVRALILSDIEKQKDYLPMVTLNLFYKGLYGAHPYGMNPLGTEEGIKKIKRGDLLRYYDHYVTPGNMVLAIVGDVHEGPTVKMVKRLFSDWPKKRWSPPKPLLPKVVIKRKVTKQEMEKTQIHFALGNLGTTIYKGDRFPLAIIDALLSGQGGKLFIPLRDVQGLAYAVSFLHREGIEPGAWCVYMATSPENLDKAIDGVIKALDRLKEGGITDDELESAKRYIIGNFSIGLQTNSQQCLSMALNERYGLGYDYDEKYIKNIEKLTKREVIKAAKRYLTTKGYVLSVVGPYQKVR